MEKLERSPNGPKDDEGHGAAFLRSGES